VVVDGLDEETERFLRKLRSFESDVEVVVRNLDEDDAYTYREANALLSRIDDRCHEFLEQELSEAEATEFSHYWNDAVLHTRADAATHARIDHYLAYITSVVREVERFGIATFRESVRRKAAKAAAAASRAASPANVLALVKCVCERFHESLVQLQPPHRKRTPYVVENERDVQDLLNAILAAYVESEVRPEEPTPSVMAGWSLIDFVLSEDGIALEVKYIGPESSTKASDIADQLLIDIGRYPERQDIREVVCFVYDPARRIRSAKAFVNDLERRSTDKVKIHAVLSPHRF
jgi:hypothetical protein